LAVYEVLANKICKAFETKREIWSIDIGLIDDITCSNPIIIYAWGLFTNDVYLGGFAVSLVEEKENEERRLRGGGPLHTNATDVICEQPFGNCLLFLHLDTLR
jgi:hypothetical protein